jgi:hypothetical protein
MEVTLAAGPWGTVDRLPAARFYDSILSSGKVEAGR